MSVEKLWDIVNGCETIDDVTQAEVYIKNSELSISDYDELMDALAYVSRECYRRRSGRA